MVGYLRNTEATCLWGPWGDGPRAHKINSPKYSLVHLNIILFQYIPDLRLPLLTPCPFILPNCVTALCLFLIALCLISVLLFCLTMMPWEQCRDHSLLLLAILCILNPQLGSPFSTHTRTQTLLSTSWRPECRHVSRLLWQHIYENQVQAYELNVTNEVSGL